MSAEPPVFPEALDDDADDVTWALQTAHARWERGGHADAIVWIRRAAQSALELSEFGRAADLEKAARQIDLWLQLNASSGLMQAEEDDGVDSLLEGDLPAETDMPVLETRTLEGPTPSLVDAIEAEARGEVEGEPPVEELDEVEELEDEELIEELPGEEPALPSFPLESVPPPPELGSVPPPGLESIPPPGLESIPPPALEPDLEPEPLALENMEKPPSAPLVALEPEPMPAVPLRESEQPPPLAAFEREPLHGDDAVTLRPPSAPRAAELEADPEVADDEILLPDAPESVPPEPRPSAAVAPAARALPAGPAIDPERIANVRGLEDLTPEIHAELARRAQTKFLEPEEEVGGYGLLWVMKGIVLVMPTIADAVIGWAAEGQTVFSRGNLDVNVALRAAAGPEGAEVAIWQPEHFEEVLEKCPWVADELRAIADRFQALAGAATGLLGERLDDSMRSMVTDRSEVKLLLGGEDVFEQGKPVVGLYVVGAGELELVRDGKLDRKLGPGDLLFPSAVLTHEAAPARARAGRAGALVLYFDRMTFHELVVSVPPLLELVAMA